jgi:hypothetical protein
MMNLTEAIVIISGIQYDLSVEGLVDGRIAIFTDAIEKRSGLIDDTTRQIILPEIISILDENDQSFEFV